MLALLFVSTVLQARGSQIEALPGAKRAWKMADPGADTFTLYTRALRCMAGES